MTKCSMKATAIAAALWAAASSANALPTVLMTEGFDNAGTPTNAGWSTLNQSAPLGTTDWGPGNDTVFAAQAGASGSYTAAQYTSADAGGTLSDWLISPSFANDNAVVVTFYAQAAGDPGFSDHLRFGFSTGGTAPASFTMGSVMTIAAGAWTQYSVHFAAHGAASTARFAVQYVGSADTSNYVGIDSLTVTAVPEPGAWLMMGLGLAGLATLRRRQAA